jgi:hypothetical protein
MEGIVLLAVCCAGCSTGNAAHINTSLATKACNSFLTVSGNAPGLLGGGGLPQGQTWTRVLDGASADAKASGDSKLYKAIQSASPFIVGSYDQAAVSRSKFMQAEGKMNDVGDLCGAYGVTLPQVG